jgi:hypothetical protein
VEYSQGTFLNISKRAPFFSSDNIEDLSESIAQCVEQVFVCDFVGATITGMAIGSLSQLNSAKG